MRLYADENIPRRTVEELRHLGHDVLTSLEDGRANQSIPDEEVLARAVELQRAILTLNRIDFKRLHRQHPEHTGIIICTNDPDRIGQAQRIAQALGEASEVNGHLIRIYRHEGREVE